MDFILSVLAILGGVAGIYRGWINFVLKNKINNHNAKVSFSSFLWKDFGQLHQLFIWYIKEPKEETPLKSLIIKINYLTTFINITFVLTVILFISIFL